MSGNVEIESTSVEMYRKELLNFWTIESLDYRAAPSVQNMYCQKCCG